MEVVNFLVGNRIVAFNILNILLTEKFDNKQTSVPSEDTAFLGVKDFMGVPTPIYDLGLAMNKVSTQQENKQHIKTLTNQESQYEDWLVQLKKAVENNTTFSLTRSTQDGEFTQWLNTFNSNNSDMQDLIKRFEQPHNSLHALTEKVLKLNEQGDKQLALDIINSEGKSTLANLKRLYATAKEQIIAAYKPVTVFTTLDGQTPSLGFVVDQVKDTLRVNQADIRELSSIESHLGAIDHRVKSMIKSLITTDNTNSLLLKPEAFLYTRDTSRRSTSARV